MAEKKEVIICNVHPWNLKRLNLPSKPSQAQWNVLNSPQIDLTFQKFFHVQGENNDRMLLIVCKNVDNSKLLKNVSHDLIKIMNWITLLSNKGEGVCVECNPQLQLERDQNYLGI
jgi:hypothetical protein